MHVFFALLDSHHFSSFLLFFGLSHLDAIFLALMFHAAARRTSQVRTTGESANESEIENNERKYPRNLTLDTSFDGSRSTTRGVVS
jgi:hypothetical protein